MFVQIQPDGRWLFKIDHHMRTTYETCHLKFKYAHVPSVLEGVNFGKVLRRKGRSGFKMEVGSWWSDVMQEYYQALARRELTKPFVMAAAAKLWVEHKMEDYKVTDPDNFGMFGGDYTEVEIPCGTPECPKNIGPNVHKVNVLAGPMVMASQYFDAFASADTQTWKVISTEAGFGIGGDVVIAENSRVIVGLVGRPDLIILEESGGVARAMPVDHKTKDRIKYDTARQWKPHYQFPGYIIALQNLLHKAGHDYTVDRCVVNIAARLLPSEPRKAGKARAPRFLRVHLSYTQDELNEYQRDTLDCVTELRRSIEQNHWRRGSEFACHAYNGCDYRQLCTRSPNERPIVEQSEYVRVEPWVPYTEEET